jgi:phytoene dehydrogenase-like protein
LSASYDAIVIGAGHNGLVAAAYLARSGLRVVVLERRRVVGGAAATEELFPGFRFDTGAHRLGRLHPALVKDLELARHGLELAWANPSVLTPLPDGRYLSLWREPDAAADSIAAFSSADAEKWDAFTGLVAQVASVLKAVHGSLPPRVPDGPARDLATLIRLAGGLRRLGKKEMIEVLRVLPMSLEELLAEWFETDGLKGTLAAAGIVGMCHGPMSSGTAYMLFHHHVGCAAGALRPLQRARGGLGSLTRTLAAAAGAYGVEIRTGADVGRIVTSNASVLGVTLANGDEVRARLILSSAGPGTTFLRLLDPSRLDRDFVQDVSNVRYRGATAKVHLALGELPRFGGVPAGGEHLSGAISISPSLEYLERASDAAKYGTVSGEPYLEAVIPSISDPSMAPPGHHSMSVLVQYAPYHLREGTWDAARREALGDLVVQTLARYAPKLPASILHRHVLTPLDLEREFGLQEGSIYHGEMTLDRLYFMRPVAGWARYRTPVDGLYLCGAGAHPGGGVTGYPGYNAARRVLADSRGSRH